MIWVYGSANPQGKARFGTRGRMVLGAVLFGVAVIGASDTLRSPGVEAPGAMQVSANMFAPDRHQAQTGLSQAMNVLSENDAERYRRIFELQRDARWSEADMEIAQLRDMRLLGHVKQQRLLHPTAYKATYDELATWLRRYSDHPDADKVHALALRRKPAGVKAPIEPVRMRLIAGLHSGHDKGKSLEVVPVRQGSTYSAKVLNSVARIAAKLQAGDPKAARTALASPKDKLLSQLSAQDYDQLQAEIAAALFYKGEAASALEMAANAAVRSGDDVPLSHWIAGLSAWRLGKMETAARNFKILAGLQTLSGWDRAAAAYWAARTFQRRDRFPEAQEWMTTAAQFPHTFYGLIARQALDMEISFTWQTPEVGPAHVDALRSRAASNRALALLQAGQTDRAESELRRLHPGDDIVLREAMVALADAAHLPSLAVQLGSAIPTPEGGVYEAALYPIPPWQPAEGFQVEPALVYAVMRQESKFNPEVVSPMGATGLMQLMPTTAAMVADDTVIGNAIHNALLDPSQNVTMGQRYVSRLLSHPQVSHDLIRMLVAYNAGPGNLQRWMTNIEHNGDPLLFIESLPSRETRQYVEKVMASFWIYRDRLGEGQSSLQAVAAGQWPVYMPQQTAALAPASYHAN